MPNPTFNPWASLGASAGFVGAPPFVGPPMPPGQQPGYGSFGQGQMGPPMPPAAAAPPPVVPASPRQPPAPLGSDYEGMLRQIKEAGDRLAGDQRAVGDQYRDQMKPLMQGDLQYDLSPLAALVDSWTGSNLQRGYAKPETGQERQGRIAELQKGAAGAGLQARGTEIDALKDLASGTMGLEKLRADQAYRKDTLEIQREQNRIGRAKLDALKGAGGLLGGKPTEAQKVIDRKFGQRYEEDVVGGNLGVSKLDLAGLVSLRDQIQRGDLGTISGPSIGGSPEMLGWRAYWHPDAVKTQQQIEKAVQSSLKSTLGAQFTEKEGANILARTFDPKLPQEENLRRLDVLVSGLQAVDEAKRGAYAYYEKNGTLRGYEGGENIENEFMLSLAEGGEHTTKKDGDGLKVPEDMTPDERAAELRRLRGQ